MPHLLESNKQVDTPLTLTTGAILRRITDADLSAASHKFASIILDGIAWKDGCNGLERDTAAFALVHVVEKKGKSRDRHPCRTGPSPSLSWHAGSRKAKLPLGNFALVGLKMMQSFQISCQPLGRGCRFELVIGGLGGISRRCRRAAVLAEKRVCHMTKETVVGSRAPDVFSPDPLPDLLRQGARQLIAQAVEAESYGFLAAHADQTDTAGRRRLDRHGHLPERNIQPGSGRWR